MIFDCIRNHFKRSDSKNKFQISDYLAVTSTRASLITGAVFFAVLTAFTLIDIREFTTINNKNKWFILAMAFVIPVAIGAAVHSGSDLNKKQ